LANRMQIVDPPEGDRKSVILAVLAGT